MSISTMTSSVPYLLRSLNEWILDNGCTPYLILDAQSPEVKVPEKFVENGQIVLNISPSAVRNLVISNEYIIFNGRFGGVAYEISAPIQAVLGIVAKENGEGMWFSREESEDVPGSVSEEDALSDSLDSANKDNRQDSGQSKEESKGPPDLKIIR